MLTDGGLYRLPDGTPVRAVQMEGKWIMLELFDGTPYAGVFSFGVRRIIPEMWGGFHTAPCDLTEDDFVLVQPAAK